MPFKRYLVSGLLVWLPIWATIFVIKFLTGLFDKTLLLLPPYMRPEALFGVHVPGLGFLFAILIMFLTGLLVTNLLGRRLEAAWDRLLSRIPVVRSVHAGVKQMLKTVFTTGGQSFRRVVLVEYPRKGLWSVAFQTAHAYHEIEEAVGENMITIFIPTTPNPTSGFLMMLPKKDARELDISVDEALKMVISLGVVVPQKPASGHPPIEQGQ